MPFWLDGNNLLRCSVAAAARDRARTRAFLEQVAARRRAAGGRIVVYFDGTGEGAPRPPGGVTVRHAAPRSADAAILAALAAVRHPAEVTVVTEDRDLAARCRAAGARVTDWAGFVLTRALPARRSEPPAPEPEIDVAEWERFFERGRQ